MAARPLTVEQIAELGGVDAAFVHREMRRGAIPSQEPEVIREWLMERFRKQHRREVFDGSSTES